MIYLDYNATSPLLPSVKAAMDALGTAPMNPASIHSAGRAAKKHLEDARATIAAALSAFPNEVLFVGSGSEANNMVLRAFAPTHALLVSAVEHAAIAKPASMLGAAVIAVDSNGVVKLDMLEQMLVALGGKPALISIMLANNETGVIQPMAEIVRIARAHGALVHSDAVQALGKISTDWGLLGVDMLTLCAHKAGGPVGAGALLIRNDLPIKPFIVGGKQELSRRAGTENVPAIVGFAQMVKDVAHCPDAPQWLGWREWLEAELTHAAPNAVVMGAAAARLPNTLNISMPGVKSETQMMNLDLAGFAVSAGSACSSGRVAASASLLAMNITPEIAECALRISWGWGTTKADMEAFAAAWKAMATRLAKRAA
jgi:cysteine desulfurase